ncbi:hypothetical protein H4219_002401 [Mycoemilia scoparia]|uniref:Cation-transporting P-type ATPase N-terminal domain-containing protein n=1 Tax=Mycoemilia scoparia TaxID=417184 RepID=A0A9W8DQM6_9FUNG|nr:hypothetical protein H4219_002401 [Mycoemilia scoparia]
MAILPNISATIPNTPSNNNNNNNNHSDSENTMTTTNTTATTTSSTGTTNEGWYKLDPKSWKPWSKSLILIYDQLGIDPSHGLSIHEAHRRLQITGLNIPIDKSRYIKSWKLLLEEITEPMIILLFVIGILYTIWGTNSNHVSIGSGIAVFVAIGLTVAMEFYVDWRSNVVTESLANSVPTNVSVIREGGQEMVVRSDQIVIGDVVMVSRGQNVPADGVVVLSRGLEVNEEVFTGKSVAAKKMVFNAGLRNQRKQHRRHNGAGDGAGSYSLISNGSPNGESDNDNDDSDDNNEDDDDYSIIPSSLLCAGTKVVRGRGVMLIIATGKKTRISGVMKKKLSSNSIKVLRQAHKTQLQIQLSRMANRLVFIAIAFSVAIPLVATWWQKSPLTGWHDVILICISILYATVPEELPVMAKLVLAYGSKRLAERNLLIRKLDAADALGSVTTIITDKTGTLTHNNLQTSSFLVLTHTAVAGNGSSASRSRSRELVCDSDFDEEDDIDLDYSLRSPEASMISEVITPCSIASSLETSTIALPLLAMWALSVDPLESRDLLAFIHNHSDLSSKQRRKKMALNPSVPRQLSKKFSYSVINPISSANAHRTTNTGTATELRKVSGIGKDVMDSAVLRALSSVPAKSANKAASPSNTNTNNLDNLMADIDEEDDGIDEGTRLVARTLESIMMKYSHLVDEMAFDPVARISYRVLSTLPHIPPSQSQSQSNNSSLSPSCQHSTSSSSVPPKSATRTRTPTPMSSSGSHKPTPKIKSKQRQQPKPRQIKVYKGAVETLLPKCQFALSTDASVNDLLSLSKDCEFDEKIGYLTDDLAHHSEFVPLSSQHSKLILNDAASLSRNGNRVIAYAISFNHYKDVDSGKNIPTHTNPIPTTVFDEMNDGDSMIFAGAIGFYDPPRKEASQSIKECQDSGIRVIIATGDHPSTALSIGTSVGIASIDHHHHHIPLHQAYASSLAYPDSRGIHSNQGRLLDGTPVGSGGGGRNIDPGYCYESRLVTGDNIDMSLQNGTFDRLIDKANIFARVTPDHKMRLVQALQARGEVVAFIGDGLNDAPSLVKADVGICLSGSPATADIAMDAASLVVMSGQFEGIVKCLRDGKGMQANVRKTILYHLACKFAMILSFLVVLLVVGVAPLTPLGVIVLELFMDLGAGLTFILEHPEGGSVARDARLPILTLLERSSLLGSDLFHHHRHYDHPRTASSSSGLPISSNNSGRQYNSTLSSSSTVAAAAEVTTRGCGEHSLYHQKLLSNVRMEIPIVLYGFALFLTCCLPTLLIHIVLPNWGSKELAPTLTFMTWLSAHMLLGIHLRTYLIPLRIHDSVKSQLGLPGEESNSYLRSRRNRRRGGPGSSSRYKNSCGTTINLAALIWSLSVIAAIALITLFKPVRDYLKLVKLNCIEWTVTITLPILMFIILEGIKEIRYARWKKLVLNPYTNHLMNTYSSTIPSPIINNGRNNTRGGGYYRGDSTNIVNSLSNGRNSRLNTTVNVDNPRFVDERTRLLSV